MSSQVYGCVPDAFPTSGMPTCSSSSPSILSVDGLSLFAFGLFWGVLFGLLGASIKLARGQWRHMILTYLRTAVRPQITGMITGGLVATGLGIFLALIFLYSLLAYSTYSVPLLTRNLCYSGDWPFVTLWGIAEGPLHAVNLFFLSFGAPITINNAQQSSCFYTSSSHMTLSLFGNATPLPSWTYALLILPVISLFVGGRASAAIGKVQGIGPGAIQGALIALPFTVLMMLLTIVSTITTTYTSGNSTASSITPNVQSAGAGAINLLLWALLSGAVLGALGGAYQTSAIKNGMSKLLNGLATPLRLLSKPGYFILDRISGQPPSSQRSQARNLLYATFLCTLLLIIAAGGVGGVLIEFNQTLSLTNNQHIRDAVAVLLIALPGLLLLSTCASALSHDPTMEGWGNTLTRGF